MKQITFTKAEIIKKIKDKKELNGISDAVVSGFLQNYLKKYNFSIDKAKTSEVKSMIKEIRAKLRNYVGQFQKSFKDREKILESGNVKKLLESHSSTFERLSFYPKLIEIINEIKPSSILDLGCGLNPLALAKPGIIYYALDIREDELSLVAKFFKKNKIKGCTKVYDLTKIDENLPTADLCILFKVLDIIDAPPYALSEKILTKIKCKKFLVSFSKIKLSGKKMNKPERYWFENLLKKLNFKYKKFQSENEIFYLIDKAV